MGHASERRHRPHEEKQSAGHSKFARDRQRVFFPFSQKSECLCSNHSLCASSSLVEKKEQKKSWSPDRWSFVQIDIFLSRS